MPELPEVETVRRGLAPVMEGATIGALEARRPDLRFPLPERFAERVEGRRVEALSRRAKYLLADLEGGDVLVMHLGMSGSFRVEDDALGLYHNERGKDPAHDHVVFRMTGADGAAGSRIVYNDPRRFGFMHLVPRAEIADHPRFRALGPEPTGNALTPEHLAEAFRAKRAPLKAALLDQSVVAGLGNIYVCEALWRARLSPAREARTLVTATGRPSARLVALTGHVRDVIADAIEAGGSSLRDHARTDGTMGLFQHRFSVYDHEGDSCPRETCRGTIERVVQSGRSTFRCRVCQR